MGSELPWPKRTLNRILQVGHCCERNPSESVGKLTFNFVLLRLRPNRLRHYHRRYLQRRLSDLKLDLIVLENIASTKELNQFVIFTSDRPLKISESREAGRHHQRFFDYKWPSTPQSDNSSGFLTRGRYERSNRL